MCYAHKPLRNIEEELHPGMNAIFWDIYIYTWGKMFSKPWSTNFGQPRVTKFFKCRLINLISILTPNTSGTDNNVIIPEGVCVSTIRLPAKVDSCDLRLDGAPGPLSSIGVCSSGLDS